MLLEANLDSYFVTVTKQISDMLIVMLTISVMIISCQAPFDILNCIAVIRQEVDQIEACKLR